VSLIKNIQGRWDTNRIYLNDGSYVSITALNLHSDLYNYINGMQYEQETKGNLNIYIIKGEEFNSHIEGEFHKHFEVSLHNKCDFKFIYVDMLIKEPNGKLLPLRQLIK